MNKKKIILASVGIAILLVFIFRKNLKRVLYKMKEKAKEKAIEGGAEQDDTIDQNKLLQKGSQGQEVANLQNLLRKAGATITIDGIFGDQTEGALLSVTGKNKTTLAEFAQDRSMVRI